MFTDSNLIAFIACTLHKRSEGTKAMSEVKGDATDDNVHSERVRRIDMGCGQLMKLLSLIACGFLLVFQLSEKPVFLGPSLVHVVKELHRFFIALALGCHLGSVLWECPWVFFLRWLLPKMILCLAVFAGVTEEGLCLPSFSALACSG